MNQEELKARLLSLLVRVAPEVEPDEIDPALNFRDQVDIDSMDFLNFITAIHKQLGVNVPEVDYPQLSSLNGCLRYLEPRLGD
ncbi:MAG: acyl carrier protein [Pseudomonadota bacterium]|nr:acyl carrier protein [Pseudomonadota bacterium]